MDPTYNVMKKFLKDLDKNDYIQGKNVHLTVKNDVWPSNI